jgi:hypothetical protein
METGPRQVLENRFAAVLLCNNVIDLEWNAVKCLSHPAVFAPATSALPRLFLKDSPHEEAECPVRCSERRALD